MGDGKFEIRIEAPGLRPETAAPGAFFEFVAAYLSLLERVAADEEKPLELRGVEIKAGSLRVVMPTEQPELVAIVNERVTQLVRARERPQGYSRSIDAVLRTMSQFGEKSSISAGFKNAMRVVEAPGAQVPIQTEYTTQRVMVVRVGTEPSRVRLRSLAERRPFTVDCDRTKARELGALLDQQVEAELVLRRGPENEILDGRMRSFERLAEGDSMELLRGWFSRNVVGVESREDESK